MGSGLILLVIVGAWLAVLVPMALRSQESSSSQSTVEAFHDAMRVLARREGPAPVVGSGTVESPPTPTGLSTAARRRRVLLGLVGLALVTLLGAVLGPLWMLGVHLGADLLLVGYVGHLRRAAVLRRDRELRDRRRRTVTQSVQSAAASRMGALADPPVRGSQQEPAAASTRTTDAGAVVAAARRAQARGAAAAVVVARAPSRIAGVPDRMPSRVVVGTALYSLPVEQPLDEVVEPARGAQGGAWSPVPVPLPAYLTAPVAPRRAPAAARSDDRGERRDEGVERKRAVND